MGKVFSVVLLFVFLFCIETFAQSISEIRKQKERSEKEISYLNKLLGEALKDKSSSTHKLSILQEKILQSNKLLNSLNQEVEYIQKKIFLNEEQISNLQLERKAMLDLYAKLIYGRWKKRDKTNKLMFIFSSSDFNQAYNRFKYFQQIQDYSGRQLQLIRQVNDSLHSKNQNLKILMAKKNSLLNNISDKNHELELEKKKENQYILELQKKEKNIKRKLQVEIQSRQKLAKKLNKLIASQIKKSGSTNSTYKLTPEEKLISDDFAKNKGKLPWPVAEGFISEKFGLNNDRVHKLVKKPNDGISITTSKEADVRSVFQGIVTEIWYVPGLNNVVFIRHGDYFTAYFNLINVVVRKGDKVKTKELIGKVAYDTEKGSILDFQIWKNLIKLNPEFWLAK